MNSYVDMRDYSYALPPGRIATFPLPARDQSKLLVYERQKLSHSTFDHVGEFLPKNSTLFFNDTKVIPARLIFHKETGAEIEIFLLNPGNPSPLLQQAMESTEKVRWYCSIGNLKRWTAGISLFLKNDNGFLLEASLLSREEGLVEFSWSRADLSFAEVLQAAGVTPLPPYLKRKAEPLDRERYQTVYSQAEGAVAAPTAGLHFTQQLLSNLSQKGILEDFLTLHVSAGTFQPVKVSDAAAHDMHSEQVVISGRNIGNLLREDKKVVAVGTTSLRTLESLYWFGVKLMHDPGAAFAIAKMDPYEYDGQLPSREEAFRAVAGMMQKKKLERLTGETSIYILPGYTFKVCDGLITNFHQPGSTLLLLVAAFIGADWKKVYAEALQKDYRFLSYGDSSLLLP